MKQIELLLLKNVDNLGVVGQVVKVKPGYARNYLIPRGEATTPSQKLVDRLAEQRKHEEARQRQIRAEQEVLIGRLADAEITIERSSNEQGLLYGGVSQHDIAEALREAGFDLEDRFIRVGEQIKRLDSYQIPVVINRDLKTEFKLWVVSDKPAEELEADIEETQPQTEVEEEVSEEVVANTPGSPPPSTGPKKQSWVK